mgnify:CR=1 FL=1
MRKCSCGIHPLPRTVFVLCAILIFPAVLSAQSAGTATAIAVLQRGPLPRKSIPWIGPNALSCYFGEYRVGDEMISLYAVREFVPSSSWAAYSCGRRLSLLRIESGEGLLLFCQISGGFSFFFLFPSGFADPCAFIEPFLSRFTYFAGASRSDFDQVSFPAIFEIRI